MKKGSGKNKGNEFERKIAKKISLWLTNNKLSDAVWRTDTSGGRSTLRIQKNIITKNVIDNAGDLKMVIDKGSHLNLDKFFDNFCVEVKFYKRMCMHIPLKNPLINFFQQCLEQKKITRKNIFLIVKTNYQSTLLFTDIAIHNNNNNNKPEAVYYYGNTEFSCYLFDKFLEKTSNIFSFLNDL